MYAIPAQLIQYIDVRILGDLVLDNSTRATPTEILTDANVLAALSTASGMINSYALISQRYTVLELENLTGDDQAMLTMMTCWLAFGLLCSRRARDPVQYPQYVEVKALAEKLRNGAQIFNVASDVSAGLAQTNFPSAQTYQTVNTLRSATHQFFPVRRKQQQT